VPLRDLPPPERLDTINRLTVVARLLSSAVHDTRNALQIVTGHAELFADGVFDQEKARERSRIILAQADRATQRMQGLVDMTQADPRPAERLELHQLAEGVLALRRSSFGRARIRAAVVPALGQFWGAGVRADVIRILANLMLNAERAVTGRPAAEIRFEMTAVNGRIVITVKDNGSGIAEAVRPHLFEPFTPGDGPGLGLYVSRYLAERSGGSLDYITHGGGSEFTLSLPAAP
jgi:signal transduction histidine kinase